jgi:hypothetical protein
MGVEMVHVRPMLRYLAGPVGSSEEIGSAKRSIRAQHVSKI